MNQDDPFFGLGGDDDRTIIRPSPGGRRRAGTDAQVPFATPQPSFQQPPSSGFASPSMPAAGPGPVTTAEQSLYQDNPLVASAFPMLSLVPRLRIASAHQAIDELRARLINEMKGFENRSVQQGFSYEQARVASYALCSLLDEAVLNTPWGSQSIWAQQGMLIAFHQESWGGEKFFTVLQRLMQQPASNLYLLELCYLCLSLGFEGKFRLIANGVNGAQQVKDELYLLIQRVRGDFERDLSLHWRGLSDQRKRFMSIPAWAVAVATAVLLLLFYLGFAYAINHGADPVFKQLFTLAQDQPQFSTVAVAPPPPDPNRGQNFQQLAKDVGGVLDVADDHTLRLRVTFASGSDQIKPEFLPIIAKVAQVLDKEPGNIVIVGHTDDKPIFSARFPSNWHLSVARAKSVANALAAVASGLQPRLSFEGRADNDPLVPNDSNENRAINRRVDILIK